MRAAIFCAMLAALVAPSRASMKHPVHGKNLHSRPFDVKNSVYYQLDNTDYFRNNVEPLAYRRSTAEKLQARAPGRDMAGLGSLLDTWTDDTESAKRRQLDDEWLTWEAAQSDGQIGPLRIHFVTEFWDQGEAMLKATEQCAEVGQTVTPSRMTNVTADSSGVTIVCTEEDVIKNITVYVVNERLAWAKQYVSDTFTVKQVPPGEGITMNGAARENYPFSTTFFESTDLVIVLTMHPVSAGGIAGYAYCAQSDQFGRCTVGYFNWVPDGISDSSSFYYPNVAMAERTTALHEVMHVIGCCKDSDVFRYPDTGEPYEDSKKWVIETESPYISKQITKWVTPGVVRIAQEQYNCSTITGMPLEDVPLGVNAHWEARIAGPDVMSYGIGSGESYVSDLTLMFFNDTNQYIVNFEAGAQRIYAASGDDQDLAADAFNDIFAVSDSGNSLVLPNRSWGLGYQRWGRNMGCGFFEQPPSYDTWGSRYFCTNNNERTCSADNLMSAACYLLEYSSTAQDAGDNYYSRSLGSPQSTEIVANPNAPNLPTPYQYLVEFNLVNWGGYSSSMDFAPVRYGIWNCQDEEPSLEDIVQLEDLEFVDPGDLFSDLGSEISQFGGQIFSARSRCFASSLLLFTEAQYFSFEFESYGLCYLSNCYTENYLQVGLKTNLGGIKWFRCQEPGDIFVSGFIGSFTCPDPREFCAFEDVTGVKYTENNETLEWIFWGVLIGVLLIVFIIFCCCRKVRQCTAAKLKQLMNFDMTEKRVRPEKKSPGFYVLTIVSATWHLVGLGLVVLGLVAIIDTTGEILWDSASRQVYNFIGLGIFIIIVASLGTMTAKADHPTLKAAIYFYIVLFLLIGFAFMAIIVFALPEWLQVIVELTWESARPQFPDSWQLYTATEAWDELSALFEENAVYIYICLGYSIFSMLAGLIVVFVMLMFKNVIGTMLFWMNFVILVAGIIFIWACSTLAIVVPEPILVGLIVPGCLTIVTGVVGIATCRNTDTLVAYIIITAISFIAMLGIGAWLVANVDANADIVANLTVEQLGDLVQKLDFFASEWTEADVQQWLEANLEAAGIAAIVLSFVILGTIGAAVIVLRSSQISKAKMKLEIAAKRMDVSGAREWESAGDGHTNFANQPGIEMGEIRVAEQIPQHRQQHYQQHYQQQQQQQHRQVRQWQPEQLEAYGRPSVQRMPSDKARVNRAGGRV